RRFLQRHQVDLIHPVAQRLPQLPQIASDQLASGAGQEHRPQHVRLPGDLAAPVQPVLDVADVVHDAYPASATLPARASGREVLHARPSHVTAPGFARSRASRRRAVVLLTPRRAAIWSNVTASPSMLSSSDWRVAWPLAAFSRARALLMA